MDEIKKSLAVVGNNERLLALSRFYYKIDPTPFRRLDPFEPAYREQVLTVYRAISQNAGYDPTLMERTDSIDQFDIASCPIPYRFGDSRSVGEFLTCYGWILTLLDVKKGDDVLEYGSGEGQLSIQLARLGCNVHAIDIEARFLDSIRRQCAALGIEIATQVGRFGDGIGDKTFDRVIFFEAFHHCLDHREALMRIRDRLKPDGFICFSGEPILADNSPDRELVPYHWGLRLDGDAVRSIAEFGWMELGFTESYFVELLGRCGYAVERRPCAGAWRGDAYIARPFGARYPIERDTIITLHDGRSGWHASEGAHRWTDGDASFPLPELGHARVALTLANLSGKPMRVELSCLERSAEAMLASGEEKQLSLEPPPEGKTLRIRSGTFKPRRSLLSSQDNRTLGIAVKEIAFS
jgi:2-polyprenyl-3-methyl-5-hydroxy-6-metoxy-1,4-benzoquinol methylase